MTLVVHILSAEDKLREKFADKVFSRKEAAEYLRSFGEVVWKEGVYRSEIVNHFAHIGIIKMASRGKYQFGE